MAKTQTKKTKKLTAKQAQKLAEKITTLKVKSSDQFALRENLRGKKVLFLRQIDGELAIVNSDLQNTMNEITALEEKLKNGK